MGSQHVHPCALRNHLYWDTKLGRPLTGLELMRVHGFQNIKPVGGDSILGHLAGDTISIAPIGCILGIALANTSMGDEMEDAGASTVHLGPSWVGPTCLSGVDRSHDNLWHLATDGTSRTSKRRRMETTEAAATK